MPKLTGPLLSTRANGSIFGLITYQQRKSGPIAKRFSQPTTAPTLPQSAVRESTRILARRWSTLTADEKQTWTTPAPQLNSTSSANYFVRQWQLARNRLDPTATADPAAAPYFQAFAPATATVKCPDRPILTPTHVDSYGNYDPTGSQAVHPSGLFVPAGWNGYTYLLSATPYAYGQPRWECPMLFAGNSPEDVDHLPGSLNPIRGYPWWWEQPTPPASSVRIGPDPHLFLDRDGTLYIIHGYGRAGVTSRLEAVWTTDGITWTGPTTIVLPDIDNTLILSSNFFRVSDTYHIFCCLYTTVEAAQNFYHFTSASPLSGWVQVTKPTIPTIEGYSRVWHAGITPLGTGMVGIFQMVSGWELWLATSSDGAAWTFQADHFTAQRDPAGGHRWDSRFYRGQYVPLTRHQGLIYYTGVQTDVDEHWYHGLHRIGVATVTLT